MLTQKSGAARRGHPTVTLDPPVKLLPPVYHKGDRMSRAKWAELYDRPMATSDGYTVTFIAPLFAKVNTGTDILAVTDFDCQSCGDGSGCVHQEAMLAALEDYEDMEALREWRETHEAASRGMA